MAYYFIIFVAFIVFSLYLAIRDIYKFHIKLEKFNQLSLDIKEISEKFDKVKKINISTAELRNANDFPVKLHFPDNYSLCNPNASITKQDYKHYNDSLHLVSEIIKTKQYNIKKAGQFKAKYS